MIDVKYFQIYAITFPLGAFINDVMQLGDAGKYFCGTIYEGLNKEKSCKKKSFEDWKRLKSKFGFSFIFCFILTTNN